MNVVFSRSTLSLLPKYIGLYAACFSKATHYNYKYLKWLYEANPAGVAIGADALYGEEVVGQVIAIPGHYSLRGHIVKGLLAVNVAVHPKFQGRHLFKKLGLKMCEYGEADGCDFVIGVANTAATIGWTRQMGFQLVTPLKAMVGFGSLGINDFDKVISCSELHHSWSAQALEWRSKNPANNISFEINSERGGIKAFASSGKLSISAYAELPSENQVQCARQMTNNSTILPRVFLGLIPNHKFGFNYLSIPERFKPSPLNLVFKNLKNSSDEIDSRACFINFLDFDAF